MGDETYYSLLEVPETATTAEIKAAYLRLIREVHPDRLANAPAYWRRQAEEKSKEINEAHAVLSNREKRRLYDAQLASYRGSRTKTSGTPTAQSSASARPSSTQQRSQTTSRAQSTSGANQHSAQRPSSPGQRYQTPSTSTPPPTSQYSGQSNTSRISFFERAFFSMVCVLFAVGATSIFWNASRADEEIIGFLLATGLFCLVAYLYRRQIHQIFNAVGLKAIKQQNWAMVGIITIALLEGKTISTNRHNVASGYQAYSAQSQLKEDRSTTVPTQKPAPTSSNVHVPPGYTLVKAPPIDAKSPDNQPPAPKADFSDLGFEADAPNPNTAPDHTPSRHIGNTRSPAKGDVFDELEPAIGHGPVREATTRGANSETYDLSKLTAPDQASIESACSYVKNLHGPASYHRCISTQLAELAKEPNAPDLNGLSHSDRDSIQSACSYAKNLHGPAAYHRCLRSQLSALRSQ